MLKKPIVLHYDKKLKKKVFCSIFAAGKKKKVGSLLLKKIWRRKPNS